MKGNFNRLKKKTGYKTYKTHRWRQMWTPECVSLTHMFFPLFFLISWHESDQVLAGGRCLWLPCCFAYYEPTISNNPTKNALSHHNMEISRKNLVFRMYFFNSAVDFINVESHKCYKTSASHFSVSPRNINIIGHICYMQRFCIWLCWRFFLTFCLCLRSVLYPRSFSTYSINIYCIYLW